MSKNLFSNITDSITPEDWRKCVQHTIGIEESYRKAMHILDDIDPVIINLDSDTSSDSDSE